MWHGHTLERDRAFLVTIELRGMGGHSSVPYKTHSPLIAGTELIRIISDKLWFELDSFSNVILTPVAFDGGLKHNVIPDDATIKYYGECANFEQFRALQKIMHESLEAAKLAYSVTYSISFERLKKK